MPVRKLLFNLYKLYYYKWEVWKFRGGRLKSLWKLTFSPHFEHQHHTKQKQSQFSSGLDHSFAIFPFTTIISISFSSTCLFSNEFYFISGFRSEGGKKRLLLSFLGFSRWLKNHNITTSIFLGYLWAQILPDVLVWIPIVELDKITTQKKNI